MTREEEARLKALVEKLEKRAEEAEARYNALMAEAEKEHKEAEESLREAEIETQRVHEEAEREIAWWNSVKDLPLEERVREICKHHQSPETDSPQGRGEALSFFPMGEA